MRHRLAELRPRADVPFQNIVILPVNSAIGVVDDPVPKTRCRMLQERRREEEFAVAVERLPNVWNAKTLRAIAIFRGGFFTFRTLISLRNGESHWEFPP